MQLVGIDKKSLTIKDKIEAGEVVESYLSIRDKLTLDASSKGELQAAMPGMPKEKTSRVIYLGESLGGSADTLDPSDRKPENKGGRKKAIIIRLKF